MLKYEHGGAVHGWFLKWYLYNTLCKMDSIAGSTRLWNKSELSKLVDYHLYFASYEDSEEKIASFSSRASLQFLLDCLFACYFNRDYEKNINYRIEHFIEL